MIKLADWIAAGAVGIVALSGLAMAVDAAEEWGIEHEVATRMTGTVVDLLCEVTGDCTDNCGNGKRQLGLLLDDGRLVPVVKNFDIFAGATADLVPFCGKEIVADGLMINDPVMPMFALQFKRLAPDGKWSRANFFTKEWSKANEGKEGKQWFRHDARVAEVLERDGVFGIPGLEPADE